MASSKPNKNNPFDQESAPILITADNELCQPEKISNRASSIENKAYRISVSARGSARTSSQAASPGSRRGRSFPITCPGPPPQPTTSPVTIIVPAARSRSEKNADLGEHKRRLDCRPPVIAGRRHERGPDEPAAEQPVSSGGSPRDARRHSPRPPRQPQRKRPPLALATVPRGAFFTRRSATSVLMRAASRAAPQRRRNRTPCRTV